VTPLPRSFAELQPNVLIARCSQCKRLAFASELCQNANAVGVCPNMVIVLEPVSNVGMPSSEAQKASLARPAV
jgi:hypothetical protein